MEHLHIFMFVRIVCSAILSLEYSLNVRVKFWELTEFKTIQLNANTVF